MFKKEIILEINKKKLIEQLKENYNYQKTGLSFSILGITTKDYYDYFLSSINEKKLCVSKKIAFVKEIEPKLVVKINELNDNSLKLILNIDHNFVVKVFLFILFIIPLISIYFSLTDYRDNDINFIMILAFLILFILTFLISKFLCFTFGKEMIDDFELVILKIKKANDR